ncbi:MAG: 2OG-Fe dioxygenase family protein, partial [Gammaproteobacteria bacterium]|nr:2OG-Fe dioxygenase family protein [Gammaproteobacteria bacterium]
MITVDADIGSSIEQTHYALVPSQDFFFSADLNESGALFRRDWEHLELDPYMADGGSYRSRRYGLYQLSGSTGQLAHIPGASFYQSIEINPLNGGEQRHFAALGANTVENKFLRELIRFDIAQLTSDKHIED